MDFLVHLKILWIHETAREANLVVLSSNGDGSLPLPIPNQAGLAGVKFYTQAGALDPSGAVILSNQIVATMGI